ncbi:hypothetical protein IC229_26200 [Spirosoma sp. BT702]|uniref:TMF family protein n=1 Tax=Spirosoma profusum TaxID=2771354 RepID=A0A926Y453_9BACT|nr:hypothetical protein [Spirosoma profusum]MBD2704163.1 hypothetical protein [Spirosoma profusum]
MKLLCSLTLLLLTSTLLAQNTNYIVTTANSATPGQHNTIIGPLAGNAAMTGDENVFLGKSVGNVNTSGNQNTFLGYATGARNTTGSFNTFLGYISGFANTIGQYNTFLGYRAGDSNVSGSSNTFVGYRSGDDNTTGYSNTFVGYVAGQNNVNGHSNTFLGYFTGNANTSGAQNTLIGYQAGYNTTIGEQNTFLGYQAGYNNTTGSNNIIIGPKSGTAIITSDDNVLMGYNSQAENGLKNAIAIGANSRVAMSNSLILGNQVNVGIGTSAPANRLEVVSESPSLTLTNLTNASPAAQTTDQFLTVNEKGEVIKARYQLRINSPSEWSDKVFASTYQLRSLPAVATYVAQHGHLPGVPSAEQVAKEGVDLVKMNATLLEKVEELTLYGIQQDKKSERQQKEIDELKALVKQLLEKK